EPSLLELAVTWLSESLPAAGADRDLVLRMRNTAAVANARPLPSGQPKDAEAARSGFEELLRTTDAVLDAGFRRAVARNLAQLHLGQGRWEAAGDAYGTAAEAAAVMIGRASSLPGRLTEIETAADVSLLHALCLLHTGE